MSGDFNTNSKDIVEQLFIALTNNQTGMLFCCSSSLTRVAGPNRTIFHNFLEKSNLAKIFQLLTVGVYKGECRPKQKFQLLHGHKSTFSHGGRSERI